MDWTKTPLRRPRRDPYFFSKTLLMMQATTPILPHGPRRLIRAHRIDFDNSYDRTPNGGTPLKRKGRNDDNSPQIDFVRRRISLPKDLLQDCENFSFSFEEHVPLELLLRMKPKIVDFSDNENDNDSCYASRASNEFSICSEDSGSCKSGVSLEQDIESMNTSASESLSTEGSSWNDDRNNVLGIEYYESEFEELSVLDNSECHPTKLLTRSLLEAMCERQDPERRFSRCAEHPKGPLALFCENCGVPMCLLCKLDYHADHQFTTLRAAGSLCQRKLRQNQRRLTKKITQRQSDLREIREYQFDIDKQRKQVEEKLKKQRDYLHEKIDIEYEKLKMQVDSVWGQEMMNTESKIASISKLLKENHAHLGKIEELLTKSDDVLELLRESKDLIECIDIKEERPEKRAAYEYLDLMTPARPRTNQIKKEVFQRQYFILGQGADISSQHLGTFNTGFIRSQSLKTCLVSCGREVFSFSTRGLQTATHMATGISLTPTGDILVTDLGLDSVRLFDPQGHRKFTLNTLPLDEPSSAIVLDDKNLMVACKNGLKLFRPNGEFIRKVQTSVDSPQGLALNLGGDIVVTDRQMTSSLIHIMARADFRNLHTIIGGNRAPLFTQAWYVTIDKENNLIISDSSDNTVKVLSSFGMLMHEFGGKGCQPGQFFHPAGVCTDSYGHILVADLCNNRIQMFSNEGEFLAIILGPENDLESPMDLTIDANGNLLVLQGNGEVKVVQYIY